MYIVQMNRNFKIVDLIFIILILTKNWDKSFTQGLRYGNLVQLNLYFTAKSYQKISSIWNVKHKGQNKCAFWAPITYNLHNKFTTTYM